MAKRKAETSSETSQHSHQSQDDGAGVSSNENQALVSAEDNTIIDGQSQQPTDLATQAQPPPPQQQPFSFAVMIRSVIMRMLIVWIFTSGIKFFMPAKTPTTNSADPKSPATSRAPSSNIFTHGMSLDFYVYISEEKYEPNFEDPDELKWVKRDIRYDDWTQGPTQDSIFTSNFDVKLSDRVKNNGSIWLHTYLVRSGYLPYESSKLSSKNKAPYSSIYTLHKSKQLNRYKKRRYKDTHNLLTGKTDKSVEEQEKIKLKINEEIISHWHPNLTVNVVYDAATTWVQGQVPQPYDEYIEFEPQTGKYYPIVYVNDYWNLLRDYQPINDTVNAISLSLTYQPLSTIKWNMYAAQGMKNKWSKMLGTEALENEEEQDYIKEALLETSPILLGLTIIVSITHSIFEFLAFKNDIQFWKDRKSLEGLSVRSVFFNVFQSVIVFLYVLDNDTNTLIKISVGIGLLIECWKIPKVVNIHIDRRSKIFGLFPKISVSNKGSYVESSTKIYDQMAYKYLSWLIFPLFAAYAVYSLLYQEHKGWYSFVLNMIYGFLLAFGFIMMTPQLFINYKMKSVAHLPWRMLTYKFLNTFIDDIFAFVIKMPMMYRIGCFRDDIVFIIFLYQKWIYRVDPTRVNEFGISGEDLAAVEQNRLETPESIEASKSKKATKSKKEKKTD